MSITSLINISNLLMVYTVQIVNTQQTIYFGIIKKNLVHEPSNNFPWAAVLHLLQPYTYTHLTTAEELMRKNLIL